MKIFLSRFGILVALLAAGSIGAGEVLRPAANAPVCIELHDQYDAPQRLTFPATNITVLTIADRKGSEQVDVWIAALKARYGERISLRGIADVGGAPSFIQARIRKKFQETRQHPVMMDWSGKVCAELNYKKGVANILVLSRDGAILGRFSGRADGPNMSEACAVLDKAISNPEKSA